MTMDATVTPVVPAGTGVEAALKTTTIQAWAGEHHSAQGKCTSLHKMATNPAS